ncbi:MAG TPA: hypothetical protein VIK91_01990 [Nannocystis sp.]
MTARNPTPRPDVRGSPPRAGGVLDPAWEDELRRGQEAAGEVGSIEPELAIVRLFRHARAPEELAPGELDALWAGEIAPAITPTPWWRRKWLWGAVPAMAAAAALLVVIRSPEGEREAPQVAAASAPSAARILAQQFAQLEADARRELDARVDDDRGLLRQDLLAMSLGAKP